MRDEDELQKKVGHDAPWFPSHPRSAPIERRKVREIVSLAALGHEPKRIEEQTGVPLDRVKEVLAQNKRAANILRLRSVEGMTLEEIGKLYGITKERVRQIIETYASTSVLPAVDRIGKQRERKKDLQRIAVAYFKKRRQLLRKPTFAEMKPYSASESGRGEWLTYKYLYELLRVIEGKDSDWLNRHSRREIIVLIQLAHMDQRRPPTKSVLSSWPYRVSSPEIEQYGSLIHLFLDAGILPPGRKWKKKAKEMRWALTLNYLLVKRRLGWVVPSLREIVELGRYSPAVHFSYWGGYSRLREEVEKDMDPETQRRAIEEFLRGDNFFAPIDQMVTRDPSWRESVCAHFDDERFLTVVEYFVLRREFLRRPELTDFAEPELVSDLWEGYEDLVRKAEGDEDLLTAHTAQEIVLLFARRYALTQGDESEALRWLIAPREEGGDGVLTEEIDGYWGSSRAFLKSLGFATDIEVDKTLSSAVPLRRRRSFWAMLTTTEGTTTMEEIDSSEMTLQEGATLIPSAVLEFVEENEGDDMVPLRKRGRGIVYSNDDLVAHFYRVWKRLGRQPSSEDMRKSSPPSLMLYFRRFGSWRRFLETQGLSPSFGKKRVNDEEMRQRLVEVTERLGRPPKTYELRQYGLPSYLSYRKRFGSWKEVLESSGLGQYAVHRGSAVGKARFSDDDLVAHFRAVWEELGRQPSYEDMRRAKGGPRVGTYVKRFGSWSKFLESQGLQVLKGGKRSEGRALK